MPGFEWTEGIGRNPSSVITIYDGLQRIMVKRSLTPSFTLSFIHATVFQCHPNRFIIFLIPGGPLENQLVEGQPSLLSSTE